MAYSEPTSRATGYTVTATDYNVFVDNDKFFYSRTRYFPLIVYPDDVNVQSGDDAITFDIPSGVGGSNLTYAYARHSTAGAGGTDTNIQIHNVTDAVDMLSTKLHIDSTETKSTTAATTYAIDTSNDDVVEGDTLRIDIDTLDSSTVPQGLYVVLGFDKQ